MSCKEELTPSNSNFLIEEICFTEISFLDTNEECVSGSNV